jgi:hypothetical protein
MLARKNIDNDDVFFGWTDKGYRFAVTRYSPFKTVEPIDLGYNFTIQACMDTPPGSAQTQGRTGDFWPTYFGMPDDHGMFTDKKGTELIWKMDNFLDNNDSSYPRAKLANFLGKYINAVVTESNVKLFQNTIIPTGVKNKKKKTVDGQTLTIGGPNADNEDDVKKRTINGDYYAFRIYNKALSQAEI